MLFKIVVVNNLFANVVNFSDSPLIFHVKFFSFSSFLVIVTIKWVQNTFIMEE